MSAGSERTAGSRNRFDAWGMIGWVFLVIMLLFAIIPLLWMFLTSIKSEFASMQYPPQWWPKEPTLENYRTILTPSSDFGAKFLRYFVNSFFISLSTTLLGILVAVPAAYAFSRFKFPGKNLLFYSVLMRNMFPAVIFLMPLFIMMRSFGLFNTYQSLILTYLTFGLPLSIWLLKGFYDNIPIQLEQAARIDGATRFQAFTKIVLPLSSPGIIATAIYAFIGAWNEYLYALTFVRSESKLPLPVGLQKFFGEAATDWPALMAAAFVMSVPVVFFFLVLQKYFVKALTDGAIKH